MEAWTVRLDRRSGVPLHSQIADRLLLAISDGRLQAGAVLPTVRQLAVKLAIEPNAVVRAYGQLEEAGVVEVRPGQGTFVVAGRDNDRHPELQRLCRDTVARARALGFSVDELQDALDAWRSR